MHSGKKRFVGRRLPCPQALVRFVCEEGETGSAVLQQAHNATRNAPQLRRYGIGQGRWKRVSPSLGSIVKIFYKFLLHFNSLLY